MPGTLKAVFLVPLLLSVASLTASADEPPLSLRVEVTRPGWEVNERTAHVLKITNQSSSPVTLPSFRFAKIKEEDAEVALYLKAHVLTMQVARGMAPVSINKDWQAHSEKPRQFPTVELQPKESLSVPFSLTRRWPPSFYALTQPGEYTLTVTLDTTDLQNDKILKGRFVSPPVSFRIVPVATFRAPGDGESPGDYEAARVAFYLHRIEEQTGEYFPNVTEMLHVQDAVPALIETLDSKDNKLAKSAEDILEKIHHSLGTDQDPPNVPESKAQWLAWWKRDGTKLSLQELLSNFGSHYQ